jgi:hypothetical protein
MMTPMLLMTIHIVTADIEGEEGVLVNKDKASPIHRRRRPAFDQPANRRRIPINNAAIAMSPA